MKLLKIIIACLSFQIVINHAWTQNEPCAAKIELEFCYRCKIEAKVLVNKKDTLYSNGEGMLQSENLCNLKQISILELKISESNQELSPSSYKFKHHYLEEDTLYLTYEMDNSYSKNVYNPPLIHSKKYNFQEAFEFTPGVRWETRGMDGSAFINVRGSGLRGIYGVQNIKMYHSQMPLNLADGTPQYELIDPYFSKIKHDYYNQTFGTGNGGTIHSSLHQDSLLDPTSLELSTQILLGSFGYRSYGGQFSFKNQKSIIRGGFIHKESKGYRTQEFLNRKNVFLSAAYHLNNKNTLLMDVLYAYNQWGLPGSISKEDAEADPKTSNLFSENNNARLEKNQLKGQLAHNYTSDKYQALTSIYLGWGNSYNPYGTSITNNGIKADNGINFGLRHQSNFRFIIDPNTIILWNLGIENQQQRLSFSENTLFSSQLKSKGDIFFSNSILSTRFVFNRPKWEIAFYGQMIAHHFNLKNTMLAPYQSNQIIGAGNLNFKYNINKFHSLNLDLGQSVSLPMWEEVVNPDGTINILKPEKRAFLSISSPIYIKRNKSLQQWIKPEIYTWYFYDFISPYLAFGIDNFKYKNEGSSINSGLSLTYSLRYLQQHHRIKQWGVQFDFNYGYQYYFIPKIIQQAQVYTHVRTPGMPSHMGGIKLGFKVFKFDVIIEAQANDKIALNFENTQYQKAYVVLNTEIKYQQKLFQILHLDLFLRLQNLTNSKYSSRLQYNDPLNRYYNPAPGFNVLFGLQIRTSNLLPKKSINLLSK